MLDPSCGLKSPEGLFRQTPVDHCAFHCASTVTSVGTVTIKIRLTQDRFRGENGEAALSSNTSLIELAGHRWLAFQHYNQSIPCCSMCRILQIFSKRASAFRTTTRSRRGKESRLTSDFSSRLPSFNGKHRSGLCNACNLSNIINSRVHVGVRSDWNGNISNSSWVHPQCVPSREFPSPQSLTQCYIAFRRLHSGNAPGFQG